MTTDDINFSAHGQCSILVNKDTCVSAWGLDQINYALYIVVASVCVIQSLEERGFCICMSVFNVACRDLLYKSIYLYERFQQCVYL